MHLLTVLIAVVQAASAVLADGRPEHNGGMHRRASLVPSCKKMLEKVSEPQVAALRDAAQLYAQHRRKSTNWQLFKMNKENPPTDIGKQHAYNTTKTLEELTQLLAAEDSALASVGAQLTTLLNDLKAAGSLPGNPSVRELSTCVYGRLNTHLYEFRPKVSIMMQHFKRPWMIQPFIDRMVKYSADVPLELLVNVDHPSDREAWALASYNTSGLVVPVFSFNVHEVRSYNRLAHMARGDILILMADDDSPPEDSGWLHKVVKIFDKWPNAGIVGIRNYVTCFDLDAGNRGEWFKDPVLDLTLHFVEKVDMAPLAVRKSAYLNIGGMDEGTSEPHECGILTDWDLCLRMWVAGWQVLATKQVQMTHDKEDGGTHKPETAERCWGKQQRITGATMETHIHPAFESEICGLARELTLQNLKLIDPSKCPYKEGCELGGSTSAA